MEVKIAQIIYKQVKVKQEKNIFTLKFINNFVISLKYLLSWFINCTLEKHQNLALTEKYLQEIIGIDLNTS